LGILELAKMMLLTPIKKENNIMFEQTFKNIDDILHKDAGCGSELDYVEQTSWILFLKYLDDLRERSKPQQLNLPERLTPPIINKEYQWSKFGLAPKGKDGKTRPP
jgi:type I restriction enzyme M protein